MIKYYLKLVFQQVIISPPYQLDDIKGNTNSKEYGYIKKVVGIFACKCLRNIYYIMCYSCILEGVKVRLVVLNVIINV